MQQPKNLKGLKINKIERFKNLEFSKTNEFKLSKFKWMVQNTENSTLSYEKNVGAYL